MPGPQDGTGRAPVADWWLVKVCLGDDETEAAAAPATTTDKARTRTSSFIIGYPSLRNLEEDVGSDSTSMLVQNEP